MFLTLIVGLVSSPYIGLAAKVVIDPGHGGSDPGAIGVNGLYEKTVTTEVANDLRDILLQKGYQVTMTRSKDGTLTLQQRVEIAKSSGADLFVSIHANAIPTSSVKGTMVLYHDERYPNPEYPASEEMKRLTPESRLLAQSVLDGILEKVPNVNRGLVPSSAYVVRMGNIPSILVETAFLTNHEDAKLLASSETRHKYAQGIAEGIMRYLPPIFSDIGRHWAKESIIRLNEQGIAQGSNGRFYPNKQLTRAELVSFIDKAFGFEKDVLPATVEGEAGAPESQAEAENVTVTEEVYGESPGTDTEIPAPAFSDLSETHWSYGSMIDAIDTGIIRGYPDGTVRPNEPVSRAEVAAVLSRVSEQPEAETSLDAAFRDVTQDDWAYTAIMQLANEGVINGVEEGLFAPKRAVTRAEMATMLDRKLALAVSAEENQTIQ